MAVVLAAVNIFGGFLVTAAHARRCSRRRARADERQLSATLAYLVAARPVHPGAARPVAPRDRRAGQPFGMIGMAVAIVATTAALPASAVGWGFVLIIAGLAIGGAHRRRRRAAASR
jgi:NAD/NADP transhydrogenase alpha subunit